MLTFLDVKKFTTFGGLLAPSLNYIEKLETILLNFLQVLRGILHAMLYQVDHFDSCWWPKYPSKVMGYRPSPINNDCDSDHSSPECTGAKSSYEHFGIFLSVKFQSKFSHSDVKLFISYVTFLEGKK